MLCPVKTPVNVIVAVWQGDVPICWAQQHNLTCARRWSIYSWNIITVPCDSWPLFGLRHAVLFYIFHVIQLDVKCWTFSQFIVYCHVFYLDYMSPWLCYMIIRLTLVRSELYYHMRYCWVGETDCLTNGSDYMSQDIRTHYNNLKPTAEITMYILNYYMCPWGQSQLGQMALSANMVQFGVQFLNKCAVCYMCFFGRSFDINEI